jgi:hypothetical protein
VERELDARHVHGVRRVPERPEVRGRHRVVVEERLQGGDWE